MTTLFWLSFIHCTATYKCRVRWYFVIFYTRTLHWYDVFKGKVTCPHVYVTMYERVKDPQLQMFSFSNIFLFTLHCRHLCRVKFGSRALVRIIPRDMGLNLVKNMEKIWKCSMFYYPEGGGEIAKWLASPSVKPPVQFRARYNPFVSEKWNFVKISSTCPSAADWFTKDSVMCYRVYVIMHVKAL